MAQGGGSVTPALRGPSWEQSRYLLLLMVLSAVLSVKSDPEKKKELGLSAPHIPLVGARTKRCLSTGGDGRQERRHRLCLYSSRTGQAPL